MGGLDCRDYGGRCWVPGVCKCRWEMGACVHMCTRGGGRGGGGMDMI